MKWFKHDTDAFMSEGIDAIMDIEGFAGYGRWIRILEIVALKMDETTRCHAEYSIQKWCRLLGLKQKKLISFLELTEKQLKTKVVYSENIIRIEIPNLLKKRDNYTKNLQVTTKPLVSKEVEVEVEVEVDKKVIKDIYIQFPELNKEAWDMWKSYKRKIKSPYKTERGEKAKISALIKLSNGDKDVQLKLINHAIDEEWKGIHVPNNKMNSKGQAESKHTGLNKKDYSEGVNSDGSF